MIYNRKFSLLNVSCKEQTLAPHVVRAAEMSFTVVSTS